jgi:adenine-specific DNA methylase
VLEPPRVRTQLRSQRGGADVKFDSFGTRIGGARLLAVVAISPDKSGRHYRLATEKDYEVVRKAQNTFNKLRLNRLPNGLCEFPDEPMPTQEAHRATASARVYGIQDWGDIFTARQKVLLSAYTDSIRDSNSSPQTIALSALALDRLVMQSSAHCRWKATGPSLVDMFGRHTIGMEWSFAESVPHH